MVNHGASESSAVASPSSSSAWLFSPNLGSERNKTNEEYVDQLFTYLFIRASKKPRY